MRLYEAGEAFGPRQWVRENPWVSLGVAVAAGYLLGGYGEMSAAARRIVLRQLFRLL